MRLIYFEASKSTRIFPPHPHVVSTVSTFFFFFVFGLEFEKFAKSKATETKSKKKLIFRASGFELYQC